MRDAYVSTVIFLTVMIGIMVTGPTRAQDHESGLLELRERTLRLPQPLEPPAAPTARPVITGRGELVRTPETAPLLDRFRFSTDAINDGRVIAVEGTRAEVVNSANLAEMVTSNTVFVEKVRPTATIATLPDVLTPSLPGGVTPPTAYKLSYQLTALNAMTNQPVKLDAWARDSTGLSLDSSTGYTGEFHVALVNASNTVDRSTLASPVTVAIAARGATHITPRPLEIVQLAQWHEVSITVPDVEDDTYYVAVSANPGSPGDPVELSVSRPTIEIWSTPSAIIGWGIGHGTINVKATGMRRAEGFQVPLTSTHGTLEAGTVVLNASGQGSLHLRSSSDPATSIEVTGAGLNSEPLQVPFKAPWLFLGAAIAGGLVGAFLRGRGRHHWARALTIGAASAVVMTIAYAVGIDWTAQVFQGADIARAGEAVVFVLGAVGALLGVSMLVPGSGASNASND